MRYLVGESETSGSTAVPAIRARSHFSLGKLHIITANVKFSIEYSRVRM